MTNNKTERPKPGTPEFKEWLKKQTKKDNEQLFGENYKPADFDESGAIFGDIEDLGKSDAELFPEEIEEHTPEERRDKLKVYSNPKSID